MFEKGGLRSTLFFVMHFLLDKPGDQIRLRQVLERKQRFAWLDAISGNTDQAWEASNAIEEEWQVFSSENGSDDLRTLQAYSIYLLDHGYGETDFLRVCKAYSLCVGQ